MHLSGQIRRLTQGILVEKRFVRIATLPLAFTVRVPSQNIYITTICNCHNDVRKNLLLSEFPVDHHHMPWGWGQDSLWKLH